MQIVASLTCNLDEMEPKMVSQKEQNKEQTHDNTDKAIRLFVEAYERASGFVEIPRNIDRDLAEEFEELSHLVGLFDERAIEQWRENLISHLSCIVHGDEIIYAMINFILAVNYLWQVVEKENTLIYDENGELEEDQSDEERDNIIDQASIDLDGRFEKVLKLLSQCKMRK